jgi:hypothetical protein
VDPGNEGANVLNLERRLLYLADQEQLPAFLKLVGEDKSFHDHGQHCL